MMWTPKTGGHLVCKNTISGQFANFMSFYVKIVPQNWKISQNAREAREAEICSLK